MYRKIDIRAFGASRTALRGGLVLTSFAAVLAWSATAIADGGVAASSTNYSANFHVSSSGGKSLQNGCFRLSGTLGQIAPGYSSGTTHSLIAGFWVPAVSGTQMDEIFFDGLQGC